MCPDTTKRGACAADGGGKGLDKFSPKARQIILGARAAFDEMGYEGASVDEIARRAGVSKPTLYAHFGDKQALFVAAFNLECEETAQRFFDIDGDAPGSCMETVLRAKARFLVRLFLSPVLLASVRGAVAEAPRFPELGRSYYSSGPDAGRARLAELLSEGVETGFLDIPDIDLAAHQFMELCKADAFYKRLLAVEAETSEAEMDRIADGAVGLFLRGYRAERATGPAAASRRSSAAAELA